MVGLYSLSLTEERFPRAVNVAMNGGIKEGWYMQSAAIMSPGGDSGVNGRTRWRRGGGVDWTVCQSNEATVMF